MYICVCTGPVVVVCVLLPIVISNSFGLLKLPLKTPMENEVSLLYYTPTLLVYLQLEGG